MCDYATTAMTTGFPRNNQLPVYSPVSSDAWGGRPAWGLNTSPGLRGCMPELPITSGEQSMAELGGLLMNTLRLVTTLLARLVGTDGGICSTSCTPSTIPATSLPVTFPDLGVQAGIQGNDGFFGTLGTILDGAGLFGGAENDANELSRGQEGKSWMSLLGSLANTVTRWL
ncbi:MAG: hypothetical protein KDD69_02730 [Bdellovibrionales bacterium]|nr:hypothetical protein [Bdellovibrionales bacterium]